MILFLAPFTQSGLGDLLIDDWGVVVDDDLILDPASDSLTEEGDLIIRAYTPHPITQTLIDYKEVLTIGRARSVRPLPGHPAGAGLTVVTLAATSKSAWGEINYAQRGIQTFAPGIDIRGLPQMEPPDRLGVAVASERVPVRGDLPFSVPGGKLVVIGTGDMISQCEVRDDGRGADVPRGGQLDRGKGRVAQRAGAADRPVLAVPQRRRPRARLRYTLMLALPGIAALLGIAVYWARRN